MWEIIGRTTADPPDRAISSVPSTTITPRNVVPVLTSSLAELIDPAVPASAFPVRADAIELTRAGYRALYETAQTLEPRIVHALAAVAADRQGAAELAEHHRAASRAAAPDAPDLTGEELPGDAKLRAIFEHVDLIAVSPALVERDDQLALEVAGVTADEIVLVSQIVAFTSFLLRATYALDLIAGRTPEPSAGLARPTVAHGRTPQPSTHTWRGSEIPTEFTRDVLAWEPWVPAPAETDLTAEQADSFAAKATTNSEYFRLLSRVPAILKARSALDNAVFLGRDGLPRGERELAAAVASRVNDCIYCASVHARKAEFQTKRADDIDRLLHAPLDRDDDWVAQNVAALADGQDARWAALIRFAAKLSEITPTATRHDIEALAREGIEPPAIADAAFATAFFAWANRLMLSLGEPAIPGSRADH